MSLSAIMINDKKNILVEYLQNLIKIKQECEDELKTVKGKSKIKILKDRLHFTKEEISKVEEAIKSLTASEEKGQADSNDALLRHGLLNSEKMLFENQLAALKDDKLHYTFLLETETDKARLKKYRKKLNSITVEMRRIKETLQSLSKLEALDAESEVEDELVDNNDFDEYEEDFEGSESATDVWEDIESEDDYEFNEEFVSIEEKYEANNYGMGDNLPEGKIVSSAFSSWDEVVEDAEKDCEKDNFGWGENFKDSMSGADILDGCENAENSGWTSADDSPITESVKNFIDALDVLEKRIKEVKAQIGLEIPPTESTSVFDEI